MIIKMRKPRVDFNVAFDFDGTLFKEGSWPCAGAPIEDTINALKMLHEHGVGIIIWTLRTENRVEFDEMMNALRAFNVPFDEINKSMDYCTDYWKHNPRKVDADMFVDDRNVGGVPSARAIVKEVLQRFQLRKERGHLIYFERQNLDSLHKAYREAFYTEGCEDCVFTEFEIYSETTKEI
jgi:hypothetical protein